MKRIVLLSIVLFAFSSIAFSQETNEISKIPQIRKGEIILTDGTSIKFRQLNVSNDTVVFSNFQEKICKYPANAVYKISRTGNFAAIGAITTGLGGLLGGIAGTIDWDNYDVLKGQKTSFIVGATLIGAFVGGITGALIKKEKTVYKNSTAFSFQPGLNIDQERNMVLMLLCRINIY